MTCTSLFCTRTSPIFPKLLLRGLVPIPEGHELLEYISHLRVDQYDVDRYHGVVYSWMADIRIGVHTMFDDAAEPQEIEDAEEGSSCSVLTLPSRSLEGLWESLIFEHDVKTTLLNYCRASLLFSDMMVDANVVTHNRVVLLHGPPGTGKTSLCKALAHKLAIRLQDRFERAELVEINTHSLFSKWFSESGKLVMKMFGQINELADDPNCFLVMLLDEVESLSASRQAAMAGNEPSDALRVVNALLTQLDALKRRKNVLVLCTSNITEAIDVAFLDRADLKLHIDVPTPVCRYDILVSMLSELATRGIVTSDQDIELLVPKRMVDTVGQETFTAESGVSATIRGIVGRTEGLSGRALRKLPFITFSRGVLFDSVGVMPFMDMMATTADEMVDERRPKTVGVENV